MDQIKTPEQVKQEEEVQNAKYPFPKYERHILKTSIIIFVDAILLILIAVGVYFVASPVFKSLIINGQKKSNITVSIAPTGTSLQNPLDWQTYNAPSKFITVKSPYSFKYPPNWQEATTLRYVQNNYIEDVIGNSTSDLSKRYILTIDTILNNNASTLEEFIAQHQTNTDFPDLALNTFSKDTSIKILDAELMIDRGASGEGR